ncbi:MAG TPA: ABC transporter permease [Gammaproteobacteria bacterium]
MLIGEIILVAFQSIRANLFRAILTMLGIIIGVAAVITMLAAGAGAQRNIDEQIAALGSNILTINASQFFARGISRNQLTLKIDDVAALRADSRYLDLVVPELQNRGQLKFNNVNANARLAGTTAEYREIFNYDLQAGRFFTAEEDDARKRIVVLGADIPERLESDAPTLVGKTIDVNGQPFEVIGVLESVGGGFGNSNPDQGAFVPLRTAEQRVFGTQNLENISVRVRDGIDIERAMVDIERVLRKEHKILPGEANDFAIVDRREFLATQQEAQQTFTYLLASIAGVSLIVGGIGIMNIMLVSVTERTREIGIRMALGATRLTILAQFLVESVTLCMLGGLLGVGIGYTSANLLSRYFEWQAFVSWQSVGLASAFSVGVGLFFGIWPARRAARLDPIEALRYE